MAAKKYSTGNGMIRAGVIVVDFIVMNLLLFLASRYLYVIHILYPPYFQQEPREVFIAANFAMAISQFVVGSIIHRRRTGIDEVFISVVKLCLLQVSLMFVSLRLLGESGGMFQFMGLFLVAETASIFFVRLVEKLFISYFRQAGRNTRSVVFVGSDPSLLILYRNLISDSSTGYKIRGYFADEMMENCPDTIPHLGNIESLNRLIDSCSLNVREEEGKDARGLDISAIDELFVSLSHDENAEIVRLMRFCDKNLVHFYYVPRMSGNFLLNLQPEQAHLRHRGECHRVHSHAAFHPHHCPAHQETESGTLDLQAGTHRTQWPYVHLLQVPLHARQRRCRPRAGHQG